MTQILTSKVAIITVSYNAGSFIEDYLDSVLRVLPNAPSLEVIIIDNASSDNTVDCIHRRVSEQNMESRFSVLSLPENLGFGGGCNEGARIAAERDIDKYWFLNPDTTIDLAAFEALVRGFQQSSKIAFTGSILKNERGEKRSTLYRFPTLGVTFLSTLGLGLLDRLIPSRTSTIPTPEEPKRADWLSGASFMIKKEVFNELKGFDPQYFLYFEEVDLFLRASRLGHEAWGIPESCIFHISGASTGINQKNQHANRKRKPAYWYESRRHFYIKNYGRLYFLLIDIVFVSANLLKRLKNMTKRGSSDDPSHLLRDILSHSVLLKH